MKNIPLFNRRDLILIASLLLIAGGFALFSSFSADGQTATVTCDGETVTVIDLTAAEDETFSVNGTVIEVKNGEIGFIESDCPDKTCVRTGSLKNNGDAAACIPNKVAITVKGGKSENDVDIIAY